jgi:hypothetical protein
MRLIDADALDYELGASDREIYAKACLGEAPTIEIISSDTRSEIINYFYEFNVRANIKIESLVDDVITIINNNLERENNGKG